VSSRKPVLRPIAWSGRARGAAALAFSALLLAGCGQSPEEMLASAKTYLDKQDLAAASIQLKNALQENGSLAEARFLLGRIHLEQGDVLGAVKELQRAQELGYARDETAPLLARALADAGEFDKLLEQFADLRVGNAQAQASILAAVGDAHLAKGNLEKARAAFLDALVANDNDARARIGLTRVHLVSGDLEAAEREARLGVERHPELAIAHASLADARLMRGEPVQALDAMREAVRLAPKNVNYHNAYVMQLLRSGKADEAGKALEAMQAAAPNHPLTRYIKAVIDFRDGRLAEARDNLTLVLKDAPNHLPAELLAGAVLVRLNEHALGRTHLGRVLERAPRDVFARQSLIVSHLATGEAQRALELLEPLLQMAEPDARQLGLAGQVFLANGDFERAEAYFDRAAQAAPEDPRARVRLGITRMATGDAEAAFADLENAAQMDESGIQADLAIVMGHLRRGEADKALEAQAQLERKQPDNPLVHNLRGGLMLAKRDVPAAREAFEKALAIKGDYLAAAVNLARLDLAEQQSEQAIARIKTVADQNPQNVEALLTLAEIQRATGAKPAEVLTSLERAEAASPGAVAPNLAIVRHHLGQGDFPRALQLAQKVAAAHGNDARVVEILARAQLASGDSQQAISALNRLGSLLPRSPQPHIMLADVQRSLKDNSAAEQALRRALSIAPDATEAQQRLIALLVERGDRDGALKLAREAQSRQAERPAGYLLEGEIHANGGKWNEAAEAYRKALEANGGGPAAVRLHGALLRAERRTEADRAAAAWLEKQPDDLIVRGYLSEIALSEGRHADAMTLLSRMHEMVPQNALILNNLAWTAKEMKDPKALEYGEQALRLAPDNPAILDTVGMIQVEGGDIEKGLVNLQRAVSLGPDLLPLQLNLARALAIAGRKDEARAMLEALLPRLKEGTSLHREALAVQGTL